MPATGCDALHDCPAPRLSSATGAARAPARPAAAIVSTSLNVAVREDGHAGMRANWRGCVPSGGRRRRGKPRVGRCGRRHACVVAAGHNNNEPDWGNTHVQGTVLAGSIPERLASRARAGVDLPRQRHQVAGHHRIVRPVRRAAAQYRQSTSTPSPPWCRRATCAWARAAAWCRPRKPPRTRPPRPERRRRLNPEVPASSRRPEPSCPSRCRPNCSNVPARASTPC
jgi:hypothetical protein